MMFRSVLCQRSVLVSNLGGIGRFGCIGNLCAKLSTHAKQKIAAVVDLEGEQPTAPKPRYNYDLGRIAVDQVKVIPGNMSVTRYREDLSTERNPGLPTMDQSLIANKRINKS